MKTSKIIAGVGLLALTLVILWILLIEQEWLVKALDSKYENPKQLVHTMWVMYGVLACAWASYLVWIVGDLMRIGGKHVVVALMLVSFVTASTQSARAQGQITNQTVEIKMVQEQPGIEIILTPEQERDIVKAAIFHQQMTGEKTYSQNVVAIAGGVLLVVLVTVTVTILVIYIGWKIHGVIKKIGERRKKQIEREDGDGSSSNSVSRAFISRDSFAGDLVGVYRAAFVISNSVASDLDLANNDSLPPHCFSFAPTTTATSMQAYKPAQLIDFDDYLLGNGLSTNLTVGSSSYSLNGIPCEPFSEITFENGVVNVNIPGMTNVMHRVLWSTNRVNWESVGEIRAPLGAQIKFGDSYKPNSINAQYWRVETVQ